MTPPDVEDLLRSAYDAFNARDIEGAVSLMRLDVNWPNAFEGGRVAGREAVRDYWLRQFSVIDPRLQVRAIRAEPDGRFVASVRQTVSSLSGELLADGEVEHIFTLRDGLIARMDIREP